MMELLIKQRLSAFYSSWRTHNKQLWGNADIIVLTAPEDSDSDSDFSSSSSLSLSPSRDFLLWLLLDDDVAETTAVFTPSWIFFLCTLDSLPKLLSLGRCAREVMNIPVSVEVIKGPNDCKLDGIIRNRRLRLLGDGDNDDDDLTLTIGCIYMGCIYSDIPKSELLLYSSRGNKFSKYRTVSVNLGVQNLIALDLPPCLVAEDQNKTTTNYLSYIFEKKQEDKKFVGVEKTGERLRFLYSSWRKYRKELWGESDVLVVTTSTSISSHHHPISSSFFLWLLGRDYPNTTAIFTDQAIYFFCPYETHAHLVYLGMDMRTEADVCISAQPNKVKASDEESEHLNSTLYAALWRTHPAASDAVIMGYIDGESLNSKVFHRCCVAGKLDERRFQATNVITGFVKLLNSKSEGEEGSKLPQTQSCLDEDTIVAENGEQQQQHQEVMSLMMSSSSNCNCNCNCNVGIKTVVSDDDWEII